MNINRPTKSLRIIAWLGLNAAITLAVAVTNGLLVYSIGAVSSCLLAAWMLTPFLIRKNPSEPAHRFVKIALVTVGVICGALFTYGHPFYLVVTIGVTIHAMRVLNRYSLTPLLSIVAPIITMLPLIPISHASYMPFTISSITYRYEAIGGYAFVVIALFAALLLLKKDDWTLLPIIGKSPQVDGFENVGTEWRL
jgi:hypothetical protein